MLDDVVANHHDQEVRTRPFGEAVAPARQSRSPNRRHSAGGFLAAVPVFVCAASASPINVPGGVMTPMGVTLHGRLVWHSYDRYAFEGVRSWMADFDAKKVTEITLPRLKGAMNYHFNSDGTEVVFMSDDRDLPGDQWDIWLARITPDGLAKATRITPADGSRNEDPKFSSDGSRIIFKKNRHHIAAIDRTAITIDGGNQEPAQVILASDKLEIGMPFFLAGSRTDFLYAAVTPDRRSIIGRHDAGGSHTLYDIPGAHAYYPVAVTPGEFYFSSGISGTTPDQLYKGNIEGRPPVSASFNIRAAETADACPAGPEWLFYSSTRDKGTGGYDVWLGNFSTGATCNLSTLVPGANQPNSDLGATFHGCLTTRAQSGIKQERE
ncbi:MAG: hypothetical protein J0M04_24640 [Verrucomicrobia bacterium]|nr:hypothetical protein [Verrucomicrobiota bacterium]